MELIRNPNLTMAFFASNLLRSLDQYYPNITDWYVNTVLPGTYTGEDKIIIAMEGEHMVGLALGKKAEESKLRCIRVVPEFQNRGLGIRLIDAMLEELECEKPHLTVAEEMLHLYSRAFVNRYGFELNAVEKGLYRRGKLEYLFN